MVQLLVRERRPREATSPVISILFISKKGKIVNKSVSFFLMKSLVTLVRFPCVCVPPYLHHSSPASSPSRVLSSYLFSPSSVLFHTLKRSEENDGNWAVPWNPVASRSIHFEVTVLFLSFVRLVHIQDP